MKEKELRRSMAVFTIGTVMKLTDLTARQIRYYEEQQLVQPQRTETNRRMYSLSDIDRLLEIKDYLSEGLNITAIRRIYQENRESTNRSQGEQEHHLTDEDVRRILYKEILDASGFNSLDKTKWKR
ncbi:MULTISPECIES: MerR family transcriptional regulator [Jeotgalibaca]|jgi:MerR family transcriptional regulator, glutamine synthetase repressor|uniref:MerR family transcriptional regulator n=1 Tax=Jeotgalibaca arthritidis TaxID=1868794 RepID=A0A6G7K9I6_9LACT|nr:MerR family transcriptional regulator [Jeotgalibaca arthritidis]QII81910.1 MerR family transcriptional regulator [Jeotgalibaca arthritidis]HJB24801.1 MerR family transcriptional regulator [Candidatus Jeotgalibaca pullicola]